MWGCLVITTISRRAAGTYKGSKLLPRQITKTGGLLCVRSVGLRNNAGPLAAPSNVLLISAVLVLTHDKEGCFRGYSTLFTTDG